MPQLFDRVMEGSTTESTDPFILTGAAIGYQTFDAAVGSSSNVPYCIEGSSGAAEGEWEVGFGTFVSPDQLIRDTVLASSNGGAAVEFSTGDKRVFLNYPAALASRLQVADGTDLPTLDNDAALAVGPGAVADGADAVSVGSAVVAGQRCTAVGNQAEASAAYGVSGVAIGQDASSNAGVAIGQNATGNENAVVIGPHSSASPGAASSVSIGHNAIASGGGVAIGYQANTNAGGVAIGSSAAVDADYSVAIGSGARAVLEGSNAIGDATYSELVNGGYARGRRYNLTEYAVFLEGTTNAGTASVNLEAVQYAGEMEPISAGLGLLYGYVYALGSGDSDGEQKIIRVEAPFHMVAGVVTLLGAPTYTEVYESAGATGWTVAVVGSAGILRVTASNDSTDTQAWKAKLWVEHF